MCSSTGAVPTRRSILAAGATALLGTAGCLREARTAAGRDQTNQLELEIRTLPADSDPHAIRIARHLEDHLTSAGIAVRINTLTEEELHRQVLLNRNFDLYVGQLPESTSVDPDALYPLLHSKYGSEPGWQNPFGYADPELDALLEEQRGKSGDSRRDVVADIQRHLAGTQPFVPIVFPDELSAVRSSRFHGWEDNRPTDPVNLLSLERRADASSTLRLVTTDARITENRNPLAVEFRRHGSLLDLLYAPLARRIDGEIRPWLAREWERLDDWGSAVSLRVTLREGLYWHDDERVDAEDVAFTHRFLKDTSLGRTDSAIPTSRFRGRTALVEEVRPIDDRTFDVRFSSESYEVATRGLTVPLLPRHVWSEQTGPATIAGIEVNDETTEALVWANPDPIGCGRVRFVEATSGEQVVFESVSSHPLSEADDLPERFRGEPAFDRLRLDTVPSDVVAVESIAEDEADATVSNLGPNAVPRIARSPSVTLVSDRSRSLYHLGFNTRQSPLSNFRFRTTVAQLIDKATVVNGVFDGYAMPATSPLSDQWVPDDLVWDGVDPETPFFADSDGDFDEASAHEAFEEAGYRYNDNGQLLAGEE